LLRNLQRGALRGHHLPQGDNDRSSARKWKSLSAGIALLGHETRHVDGFSHVGGCPLFPSGSAGCDQTYGEDNLPPYGIQWWLYAKWLSGEINAGYSCLSANEVTAIANGHLFAGNNDYMKRFVNNAPPLLTMPAQPGGPCDSPTPTAVPTPSPGPSPHAFANPSSVPTFQLPLVKP
jgi:hypothetical protein